MGRKKDDTCQGSQCVQMLQPSTLGPLVRRFAEVTPKLSGLKQLG
jgi:hypothetical protein